MLVSRQVRSRRKTVPTRLYLDGKRPGRRRPQLNSTTGGGRLMYLQDRASGMDFLVDTGASHSLLPHSSTDRPSGPTLHGADGQQIPTWGTRKIPLQFGLDRFDFDFVLAAVKMPILGIDFFKHHGLLVDAASHQVLAAATLKPIGGVSGLTAALSATTPAIRQLLAEFPTVLEDGSGT